MKLSGWGGFPQLDAQVLRFRYEDELRRLLLDSSGPVLPRGMGRSYGDSALQPELISSLSFNRIRSFDGTKGQICCEAGLSLDDLLTFLIPRGWFVPVTPGTRYVSIGGMLASDVHGKNHHSRGSFSEHVTEVTIMGGDGEIVRCSRDSNSELFHASCGGMGLTGVILTISFQLIPITSSWIKQSINLAQDLDSILTHFEDQASATYSVAWIDCLARGRHLGRSVLYTGEHAETDDLPATFAENSLRLPEHKSRTVPVHFPSWSLNGYSVSLFNQLYFKKAALSSREGLVDLYSYFYPLDSVHHWNRIYGRRGFTQYQCVLPRTSSQQGLTKLLEEIASSAQGSFLAVLKLLGAESASLLGFPMDGYTLALDFPIREDTEALLQRLDRIVMAAGGRLYLTKDARMSAEMAAETYPHWQDFRTFRRGLKGGLKFASLQSTRLNL